MFGLRDSDILAIKQILELYPQVQKAHIFGSRAKGNYKNGSDIDIAIQGKSISYSTILNISEVLNEETMMPYHFDVLDYNSIQNNDLIEHINRAGIVFYESSPKSPAINQ